MFGNFLLKVSDWILKKEEEAAKNCAIPEKEIEEQLKKLQEKKEELKKRCEEEIKVLDTLIERVEHIRVVEKLRCEKEKSDN